MEILRSKTLVAVDFLRRLGPVQRGWILLLALLLVVVTALSPLVPRRVIAAGASPEVFSGERAMAHLSVIAQEAHPAGSPAQARVRDYLVQELTALGLETEIQAGRGAENVLARLPGTDSTGAIVLQAHYDSIGGPGAADNGSGTAALLEIMRALTAGPPPRNEIIALFDDGEELPGAFTGTILFIRQHPWMERVRVAVGMDTAARGHISVTDTGSQNGWMVHALARAYTGGPWSSLSGGGNYDTQPFRLAGIQVLQLEDNYPFYEKHTPGDVLAIVNPSSLQQLGEQTLAVARQIAPLDLSQTTGEQETFMFVPFAGLLHYPEAWAVPLAVLAGLLWAAAVILAFWSRLASWRGFAGAVLALALTAGAAAIGTNALWKAAPAWFGWTPRFWPDWPEVIPPYGWHLLSVGSLVILILTVVLYRLTRPWVERAAFALTGLLAFIVMAVGQALSGPRGAIIFTWPVLLGAAGWIAAAVLTRKARPGLADMMVLLAAVPTGIYLLPLLPGIFMSDGTKSVAITAGVFPLMLAIILPAVDALLQPAMQKKQAEHAPVTAAGD